MTPLCPSAESRERRWKPTAGHSRGPSRFFALAHAHEVTTTAESIAALTSARPPRNLRSLSMTIAVAVLNDTGPTLFVATWPESGHGPPHHYPELSADPIVSFVRNTTGK
jgi:hypothetical protein